MSITDRWAFTIECRSCGHWMTMNQSNVDPCTETIPSTLIHPDGSEHSIRKRIVLLHIPDVCPKCKNLKIAEEG